LLTQQQDFLTMTQRIIDIARSAAVLAAMAIGLRRSARNADPAPQPRILDVDSPQVDEAWLFDCAETPVSAEAYLLGREMSKASSALSGLRSVLSQIAALPEAASLVAAPAHPVYTADAALFDGEACVDISGVVPFEDSDLFIEHSPSWPKVATDREDLAQVA
jgi:hypothetical protein